MTLEAWLTVMAILSFGIGVQAAAGFAAGMLVVPALLWLDYTIPAAQMALLVATIPQNTWGVWTLRQEIDVRSLVWPGLARIVFFPLGLFTLSMMETWSSDGIRQIVGGFILVATLVTISVRPKQRDRVAIGWTLLTFPMSGFFQGLVGMGGPVMVLWVQAHPWSAKQSRGFLFAMYLIGLFPALVVLWLRFGDRMIAPAMMAGLSVPGILVATYLGLRVGNWLGRERLRRVTLGLLILIGLASLAAPWI